MKRIIGAALLASLAAAAPAAAATDKTLTQTATGIVPATLEASIPSSSISLGTLAVGGSNQSIPQDLTVSSNQPWGATVSSVDRTSMASWDGESYDTQVTLGSSLQWKRTTQGATLYNAIGTTPTAGNLISEQVATGSTPVTVGVQFRQPASYADAVLTDGNVYRISINYQVAQGL